MEEKLQRNIFNECILKIVMWKKTLSDLKESDFDHE